ncbi:MAG: hypothetical protein IJV35_03590 [Neisseriaceae bacterium]|nr:hypothetical protein [Neisseriaceae bacterium]
MESMVLIIQLLVWAGCIYGCYALAKKNGRSVPLAIVMGVLFSVFALIVYALIGEKK